MSLWGSPVMTGGGGTGILYGTGEPTGVQGKNGEIYLKYTSTGPVNSYGGTDDIPPGAVRLLAIELTGSQYINTGIPGNTADLRTELCYQPKSGYTSETPAFGVAWSADGYFLMLYNGKWRFHTHGVVTDDGTASTSDYTTLYTSRSEFRVNQTVYSISGSGTDSSSNVLLGYLAYQGGRYGRGNVQSMKMWSGETLIRDFVPVLDPYDTVCLYDTVSGSYFYNQGTGDFTPVYLPVADPITAAYLKVSGTWQSLIGSSIDDVG